MSGRLRELVDEFQAVVAGRGQVIDALLPALAFLVLDLVAALHWAALGAVAIALVLILFRWRRGRALRFAVGGLGGVVLAASTAWLIGSAEGYFLPGVASSGVTVILCAASVAVRRPLVAWTSHLARGWPLGWYWHPRVRPAYTEVTVAWMVFFALRLLPQVLLMARGQGGALGLVQLATGWPATILLLAVSYLYGTWRLANLAGPGVQEFEAGVEPPWEGQRRGF